MIWAGKAAVPVRFAVLLSLELAIGVRYRETDEVKESLLVTWDACSVGLVGVALDLFDDCVSGT